MAPKSKKKSGGAGWILGILFLALLVFFSTGKSGFYQQIKIKYKKAEAEHDLKYMKVDVDTLEAEADTLYHPDVIEKIAREKYGMAKKNEKIYHVETEVPKDVE